MMSERMEKLFLLLGFLIRFFKKITNWIFQHVFTFFKRIFLLLAVLGHYGIDFLTSLVFCIKCKVFKGIFVLLFPGFRISKCLYFKIKKAIFGNTTLEEDISVKFPNFAFYKNFIESRPNGDSIENILTHWKGNNYILETNHSYIQWLFPNRMPGVNREASVLRDEEAEVIRCSPELRERVKRAFEMMLEFYGMRLTSNNKFERAKNSKERLTELNNWGNHNFLRISRILLALKELGHQELMLPWMKFLAELIYKEKVLPCAESSFENYWLETLDAEDKIAVVQYKNTLIQSKDTIQ